MSTQKFDVDYFIKKFRAIPEAKWCTQLLRNHDDTQRCALGHCLTLPDSYFSSECGALQELFSETLDTFPGFVNDGDHSRYQQLSPKKRILAALKDIKKNLTEGTK